MVTDSTAYVPPGVADKDGIGEVPLHVVLGGRTGAETVEVSPSHVQKGCNDARLVAPHRARLSAVMLIRVAPLGLAPQAFSSAARA